MHNHCHIIGPALLLAALLWATACSSLMLGDADHQAWARSMQGRGIGGLVDELGPPYRVEDLAGGHKLYTWRRVLADHTGPQMRQAPQRDGRPVFLTEYTGPAHYNTEHLMLWVGPAGKVYRARWDHRRTDR